MQSGISSTFWRSSENGESTLLRNIVNIAIKLQNITSQWTAIFKPQNVLYLCSRNTSHEKLNSKLSALAQFSFFETTMVEELNWNISCLSFSCVLYSCLRGFGRKAAESLYKRIWNNIGPCCHSRSVQDTVVIISC